MSRTVAASKTPANASPSPATRPIGNGGAIPLEVVALARLKPHPRNYRQHPPDQLAHIIRSIEEHGLYRNIVVAEDYTILAGHGVVKALLQMGRTEASIYRLPVAPDSVPALKLLAGDNEIGRLAEIDDRTFTEVLQEIKNLGDLLGTGYDDMMLANLMYVTAPPHAEHGSADGWMPEDYGAEGKAAFGLMMLFRTAEDRDRFIRDGDIHVTKQGGATTWSAWWPPREMEDLSAIRLEAATQ